MEVDFTVNQITFSNWENIFKLHGAVFLTTAGLRHTFVLAIDGYYWSSSPGDSEKAYYMYFSRLANGGIGYAGERCYGRSVRLVQDVE